MSVGMKMVGKKSLTTFNLVFLHGNGNENRKAGGENKTDYVGRRKRNKLIVNALIAVGNR